VIKTMQVISVEHGHVLELCMNRPPVNALSAEFMTELRTAIERAPREGAKAIVLSGSPGRFSAGLDVPLLLSLNREEIAGVWRELYALLGTIAASPVPIAAAITGHPPAGGTVLVIFCDWRVMANGDYKLGLNEVQVGIQLPPVILAGLRRMVGPRMAEQLAVAGPLLSPQEAMQCGLVDELAEPDLVVGRAVEWCQHLVSLPEAALFSLAGYDACHELAACLLAAAGRLDNPVNGFDHSLVLYGGRYYILYAVRYTRPPTARQCFP
jgi:Delta3-Delta2-enoyl-CoA isomerase